MTILVIYLSRLTINTNQNHFTNEKPFLMKKMKFLGLLLAFSFIFMHFTQAQTTVNRIAGGVAGTASVSLCSTMICLLPWDYPAPGGHTFPMNPNVVVDIVISYGSTGFWISRATVDATAGFYFQTVGSNTVLIRRVSFGIYEFFII